MTRVVDMTGVVPKKMPALADMTGVAGMTRVMGMTAMMEGDGNA